MSMGGDFYAMTDNQLDDLLSGELNYSEFLHNELAEAPSDQFTKGEHVWYEITMLLKEESVSGYDHTDAIPEQSGYSYANEVQSIAAELSRLDRETLERRFAERAAGLGTRESFETVYPILTGVIEFFQRAASRQQAVLFRVT
ncbi:DUF1877 family protein [Chitinivorax sp. B]|uniref:DUF1877 family protein n=1 Tax=Chitinivorax sp. B TaxID=2502235 RepID=UPI0010F67D16|nr:DUF1877 family protein [Chitinivorax sp. B]